MLALPLDARARVSLVFDGRTSYRGEVGLDDGCYSPRADEVVAETTTPRDGARKTPFIAFPRA